MDSLVQGSAEWKQTRLGKVTASRICDVMAKTKSGPSASRANYLAQLVVERLTGTVAESYTNGAMERGTELEPLARGAYELYANTLVDQVGFVRHPRIEMAGASPDGMINDDGLVEIKCPNSATHISYLLAGSVPDKYRYQMDFQMACTGRLWCDFVSYDDRFPPELRLFVVRYPADEVRIAEIEHAVVEFLAEVDDTITKLSMLRA